MKVYKAYKGFDENLCCDGFQFKVGETYEMEDYGQTYARYYVQTETEFYSYFNPLRILNDMRRCSANKHNQRFCEVEISGGVHQSGGNDAMLSRRIKIVAELSLEDVISLGIQYIRNTTSNENPPDSALQGGNFSIRATTETYDRLANDGATSITAGTRDWNYLYSAGVQSTAIGTGLFSNSITSSHKSLSANLQFDSVSISTGEGSLSSNLGKCSEAISTGKNAVSINIGSKAEARSTGKQSVAIVTNSDAKVSVQGENSIAIATGWGGKAKGSVGSHLVLAERDSKNRYIKSVKAILVDGERIKADTYYRLQDGEFIECN